MKGLLHRKRFKKNLIKWLCMYVGAILLFTNVVTYSKYMSRQVMKDSSRVARFNITKNQRFPVIKDYLPTEIIKYEFDINYIFDVKTLLVLKINSSDTDFVIQYINEDDIPLYNVDGSTKNDTITTNTDGSINITKNELYGTATKKYTIGVKYNYDGNENKYYDLTSEQLIKKITIAYSAAQIN